jgi:hypothetical protein
MAAMVAGKAHPLEPVEGYPGLFHGKVAGAKPYLLRGRRDGEEWLVEDAYRFGPVLGEMDEYLLGEGTHHACGRCWARMSSSMKASGHAFRGLGAQCAPGLGHRRFQRLGRAAPCHAPARRHRRLGNLPAADRRGHGL